MVFLYVYGKFSISPSFDFKNFLFVCLSERAGIASLFYLTHHFSYFSSVHFHLSKLFHFKIPKSTHANAFFFPSMKGLVTLSFVYLFRVLSPSSSELLFSNSRSLSSRRCFLHVFQSSGKFKPYTSKVGYAADV